MRNKQKQKGLNTAKMIPRSCLKQTNKSMCCPNQRYVDKHCQRNLSQKGIEDKRKAYNFESNHHYRKEDVCKWKIAYEILLKWRHNITSWVAMGWLCSSFPGDGATSLPSLAFARVGGSSSEMFFPPRLSCTTSLLASELKKDVLFSTSNYTYMTLITTQGDILCDKGRCAHPLAGL